MNYNMYYRTPFFKKKKWEEKIVNELGCQLYKIVENERFYANEDILITVNSSVTIVIFNNDTEKIRSKVKNTLVV